MKIIYHLYFFFIIFSSVFITSCTEEKKSSITNPASVNCTDSGGQLKIITRSDGGEYGVCLFEDNRQCEEWALYRGNCPVGGLKITGYQTPEATFCALKGGKPIDNETTCHLPSGNICSTKDLYFGRCR